MSYAEMIKTALKGRSVYAVSKLWGVNNMTLNRYIRGERMPDFVTAKKMAEEAGIDLADAFKLLAEEEQKRRGKLAKISEGFKKLLCAANVSWAMAPATA
ncbi:helix-turn-helix domain-containing protein [Solimicrobium silvestre]|uniref:HTH cro/C1-type domain-containing protein n=1 Tax=Solimicrobium silvestre TaxID=2099400 RepID=A0A2S9GTK1_9BURK|nr:helix-turn-helix transcriptional regulator [Solimicrobium silvestre]PRC91040.1 hypothetical protein S2091_4228 [Solimicrobium silvestre]